MSYDLMVFNPNAAPKSEREFLKWYDDQTQWNEDHNYVDPEVTTDQLRNWFIVMIEEFPALNGSYALLEENELENEFVTDYNIGKNVIYASFSWSVAEKAYNQMFELAEKYKVGFFDVSGSSDIFFPNLNGELDSILTPIHNRSWWKLWKKAL